MSEEKHKHRRKSYTGVVFVSLNDNFPEVMKREADDDLWQECSQFIGQNLLFLFKVNNDGSSIRVYERGEQLRELSEEESRSLQAQGTQGLFPTLGENDNLSVCGFSIVGNHNEPITVRESNPPIVISPNKDKIKKLKTISSICGYPDPDSHNTFAFSLIGMTIGGISGMLGGGLLAGFLGLGLAVGALAAIPGMALGLLGGALVFMGIGFLYGRYKDEQIKKQIEKEKADYLPEGNPQEPSSKEPPARHEDNRSSNPFSPEQPLESTRGPIRKRSNETDKNLKRV